MSDDSKNPFNEKTVVQTRQSFLETPDEESVFTSGLDTEDEAPTPPSGEKTMVYAKSNLKETFDARTVVMTKPALDASVAPAAFTKPPPVPTVAPTAAPVTAAAQRAAPSLPQEAPVSVSPAPSMRLPDEAPHEAAPKVVAAEIPAAALENTNPDVRVQTGSFVMKPSTDEAPATAPKKKLSNEDRRNARKALDRKTKTMVAAFATLCALVILCLLVAFGGPKTAETPSKTADASKKPQTTELASKTEPPAAKAPPIIGDYQSTTDVLGKFDRAAQKAQQHAF